MKITLRRLFPNLLALQDANWIDRGDERNWKNPHPLQKPQRMGHPPNNQLRLAFMTGDARLPHFWQPRFHDFNVYSRYKLREKLEYMHANPVKRGLVKNPGEWLWSSFWFYEKGESGLVKIDPV